MSFYQTQGLIPSKRHTIFNRNANSIYYEELISRKGFSGIYSNVYHLRMPTKLESLGQMKTIEINKVQTEHKARHIKTKLISNFGDIIYDRIPLMFNSDLIVHKVHVNKSMDCFYRNAHFDELIYIQEGNGTLLTNFGNLSINKGDYIIIPSGVIWNLELNNEISALIIESRGSIETPNRYRNEFGQLLEHSPYCERDIKTPELMKPIDKKIKCKVNVRTVNGIQEMYYNHHPFDIVGWDGYYFPWIFNINDFEPITGSIHQPPPVHQTFKGSGFVICSFVSRMFDYHENAIPSPYPHSNVDSDEVIFYSEGNFMSRRGIDLESITYHPMGLPHGPQPGKYENSIGKKWTDELAVMIDTFKPLHLTQNAINIEDKEYFLSWL